MKKFISLVITLSLLISTISLSFPIAVSAATSGTCGDNLSWNLTDSTLTISGTGDMTDWSTSSDVPWYNSKGSIKTVIIENNVTSIGNYAFYWCYALTSITISNTVTSIGNNAFCMCSGLTNITIPNTVTSIGNNAFYMCSGLTNITFPSSMTSISKSVFSCSGLTSITIPSTIKSIEDAAFWNCSSLADVYYTGTETAWNGIVIDQVNNQALLNATIHYNYSVTSGTCGDKVSWKLENNLLSIYGRGDMYGIDIAEEEAPWELYKEDIRKAVIEEGITSIGDGTFFDCYNLTEVYIPDSVNSIGDSAFYDCVSLNVVSIPEGVSSIGQYAFRYCENIESITIPNTVVSIGYGAFENCIALQTINIPGSVSELYSTFYDCDSLKSVTISNGVSIIGEYTFAGCENLTSIVIPNGVSEIGVSAFDYCSNLTTITLPLDIAVIGEYAFYGCNSLTDVYYNGTKSDWNYVYIYDNNENLNNATLHCQETTGTIEVQNAEDLQSNHPYLNNTDITWIYTHPIDAESLQVTFSDDTETESGYDFIYIYDELDTLIGKYSGTQLANKTIEVKGNVLKIKLTSDESENKNGFTVSELKAILSTGPITNLKYIARTNDTVTLSFPQPIGATNVIAELSKDGESWEVASTLETIDALSTTATLTGLRDNTQYYFRINVIGGEREGLSNEISARTSEINNFISQISEADTDAVIIRTAEELSNITEGSYVLGNDIYLENYNDGIWNPIFPTGDIVLDGQGHKIYNLNILTDYSSGLFGQTSDKIELKNLGLDYTNIDTFVCGNHAGSMIGMAFGNVKIENCFTNIEIKTLTGDNNTSGGFIGQQYNGSIEIKDSYNKGKISSAYSTGGLIGEFTGKNISLSNCYNKGEIIVDNYSASAAHSAGIVGRINDANITINNCFNEANIYGNGIIDTIYNSSAIITNTYNKGEIFNNSGLIGIISSYENNLTTITLRNCYNSGNITTNYDSAAGLISEVIFVHELTIDNCFNSGNINYIGDRDWENESAGLISSIDSVNATIMNCYNSGKITGCGLFNRIYNAHIKNSYNCGDVSMNGLFWGADNSIVELCYNIGNMPQNSTCISFIDDSTINSCYNLSDFGGFLSSSHNSTIDNCYNKGSIAYDDYVGGLVGSAYDTIVRNSYNSGNVNADSEVDSGIAGGLIGYSSNVTLENCYNIGNVGATSKYSSQAGGLIGYVENELVINNCYNEGMVSAKNAGGLIGGVYYWSTDKTRNIYDSYNKGKVSGKYRSGGIIGSSGPNVCIDECYNEGTVEATTDTAFSYAGGLIGDSDDYSENLTISRSCNLGKIISYSSDEASIAGGLVGMLDGYYNENKISNCYNTGSITSNDSAGGLIGKNTGTIINSNNSGSVSGLSSSGGISGVDSGAIENCYNTGKISGNDKVGGLVGTANSNEIKSSYNKGTVSGATYTGGIVGYGSAILDACKNIGALISNNANNLLGGLIGYINNTLAINSECSFVGAKNIYGGKADNATITGIENVSSPSNDDIQNDYEYNTELKYQVVRYDDLLDNFSWYQVTEETDLSYLNHTSSFSDCWEGNLVFVKCKDLPGDEIGYNLLKVYPLEEYAGAVESATEDTITLNGNTYTIGRNLKYFDTNDDLSFPFYGTNGAHTPDSYIGDYVCIRTCNSEVVSISCPQWDMSDEKILRDVDEIENTASISKGYYPANKYYLSQTAKICFSDLKEYVNSYIHFQYDEYGNIYDVSEYEPMEISWYDTYKPSTWEEVESAANEFINASNSYQQAVIDLLNQKVDENTIEEEQRKKGALELMEADKNSDSKILTFGSMSEQDRIYAYMALYDFMSDLGNSMDLGSLEMGKDVITVSVNMVKEVMNGLYTYKKTDTYGPYNISVNILSMGFADGDGSVSADFGSMVCTKNGITKDTIVVCSTQEQLARATEVYFNQLKELEAEALNAAFDAVIKELSGKTIDDWGKWGLKHALKKYKPELLSKGAGDVYEAINTTYTTYKNIKGLLKVKDKSEEQKIDKALSVYNSLLAEHYSDKSVSDKIVAQLYSTLSSKFKTFTTKLWSYSYETESEESKKDGWWTSIKCPTNVYVYDKLGNLIGYIEGDYIEYNDEIVLEKLGDVKRVYLPDINDYDIKVVATDNGVLNYSVEQYVDNAPIGRINYYDIELYEGKEILSSNEASTIEDYENLQLKSDNTSIVGEYISSADNASINIWGMCEGNGNIIGLGSYAKGDGVVLSAVPDEGYVFDGWYIDGELMSTNINYSFCATSELTATAKFSIMEVSSIVNFDKTNDTIIITSQEEFDEVELIVAVYLDGRLLKVESTSVDIAVRENIFDSPITDYMDGDVLKVMVWESASNLKPLFNACVVELK